MFVDENGIDTTPDNPSDPTGDTGDSGDSGDSMGSELTVTIDGEDYSFEATEDLDGDGDGDAVVERRPDGTVAFVDTDDDGQADLMVEADKNGTVTFAAEYDADTGAWTEADTEGRQMGGARVDGPVDGSITVHTPDGTMNVGPAEYDMNSDGTNDTAIVTDPDGATQVYVDTDGDGLADESVLIGVDGAVTVSEAVSDGEWQVTQTGQLNPDGSIELDQSGSDEAWSQAR